MKSNVTTEKTVTLKFEIELTADEYDAIMGGDDMVFGDMWGLVRDAIRRG